jgi:hypothetical protein
MLWGVAAGIDVYCAMRAEIDRVARATVGLAPRDR